MQELQSSDGVLYSVQTTLPEAGGQVGVGPEAVSWEWPPRAPCSLVAWAARENSCYDRLGTALLSVHLAPRAGGTTCLLGTMRRIVSMRQSRDHPNYRDWGWWGAGDEGCWGFLYLIIKKGFVGLEFCVLCFCFFVYKKMFIFSKDVCYKFPKFHFMCFDRS